MFNQLTAHEIVTLVDTLCRGGHRANKLALYCLASEGVGPGYLAASRIASDCYEMQAECAAEIIRAVAA